MVFVGNGFGLFVLPPLWQLAFAELGVRRGFFTLLSVTALAFFLAAIVCRRPRWTDRSTESTAELLEWLASLSTTYTFRLVFVGMAFSFAWYQLLAAYAVDLFVYRGLTAAGASAVFGLIGGVSIISRLGGGYLGDSAGTRRTYLGSLVCVAVGTVLLAVPVIPAVLVAVFFLGLGLGGTATLYIPLLMEIYSPEKDTAIVGVFNVAAGLTALVMPPLGTASIAYTGGFTLAILLTFAVTVIGIWSIAVGTANR